MNGAYLGPGEDLKLARAVDSLQLRCEDQKGPTRLGGAVVVSTIGTPCASASDADACAAALSASWAGDGYLVTRYNPMGCINHYLVWTAGDEVGTVRTREALLALLGPVDTLADADLLIWADGYEPLCVGDVTEGGVEVQAKRRISDCPMQTNTYVLTVSPTGQVSEVSVQEGPQGPCIGRLAPGAPEPCLSAQVGRWLAGVAALEAGAAVAFAQLRDELVHHGAPEALVRAAETAVADEQRHAAQVGTLARRYGADPLPCDAARVPLRSLATIAEDNAAEGCAREVWGAAVGLFQAQNARDPAVREAMTAIAADELAHAELSRALQAWLLPRLSPAARRRAARAQRRAWRRVAKTAQAPAEAVFTEALGLPTPAQAMALLDGVSRAG
ncbi:MAG: ferritin-like domain-containing protein [Alphaproteobacteria bacterium]|nr:ferritin-like domain-containing protein [Alphaproteobacteria bacterium]